MLDASHLEMRLMEERKLGKRDRDSRRDRRHDVAMPVSIPLHSQAGRFKEHMVE